MHHHRRTGDHPLHDIGSVNGQGNTVIHSAGEWIDHEEASRRYATENNHSADDGQCPRLGFRRSSE
jgi:hypothetical protein